nr:cyclin-T2 isoform X1 [Leptinotarsa decemlineata]
MANPNPVQIWYFTKEQLENSPSRRAGLDAHKELGYRQQAANFIQDMGQRLKVSQLCINTAIVYMHRFYVFHSFTNFPWHQMASAALFLAAKVEEQPRKLEYVIRVSNMCKNNKDTNIDINSERYISQSQDLVFNENILLQTLGFDVAIDHPHTHVVQCCYLVRASKDLAQTSYFMASNSLHLTTMCLQYKPKVVACFCILVACKWSNWEIPLSNENREWYSYVDPTVTAELLQQLTEEFLVIFESCPSRLKEKIMAVGDISHPPAITFNQKFDQDPRKIIKEPGRDQQHAHRSSVEGDPHKHRSSRPHDSVSSSSSQQQRDRANRDRLPPSHHKPPMPVQPKVPPHGHHRPPLDPKLKPHSRPPMGYSSSSRVEPRDILREAPISPFGIANKDQRETSSNSDSKRDYIAPKQEASGFSYSTEKHRIDQSRQRIAPIAKPDAPVVRRHDESRHHHAKPEPQEKKHQDKPPTHSSKPISTSQKNKAAYAADQSKSGPKQSQIVAVKPYSHNGGAYSAAKTESVKEEIPTPAVIKRPSLFSPEPSPPRNKQQPEPTLPPTALSPLTSPVESSRSRNPSSSSEPELRPVMKKIDQMEGFENLMRDTTIGINRQVPDVVNRQVPDVVNRQVPDVITPLVDLQTETVGANEVPDVVPLGEGTERPVAVSNGLETNPAVISNWLKEATTATHLPVAKVNEANEDKSSGHHHKSKKKNKEKHKHKDKSRDERDKKKKHKEKDREKERDKHRSKEAVPDAAPEPIKIKIQKDKIVTEAPLPLPIPAPTAPGLKIKIPKNKINSESIGELSQPPPPPSSQPLSVGIKLKIPREKLSYCPNLDGGGGAKKRDREPSSPPSESRPVKVPKLNKDYKTNGRHSSSSSKVSLGGPTAHAPNRYTVPPEHRVPPPGYTAPPPGYTPPHPRDYRFQHPPPPPPANPVYFFPAAPPPSMPNVTVPPPYVYHDASQVYPYYGQGYVYHPEMYQHQQMMLPPPPPPHGSANPPLPVEAPPNAPPPPPPPES